MQAYESNHWQAAYAGFAAPADRGDLEAARITPQMSAHGRSLYGTAFVSDKQQRVQWLRVWVCATQAAAAVCRIAGFHVAVAVSDDAAPRAIGATGRPRAYSH